MRQTVRYGATGCCLAVVLSPQNHRPDAQNLHWLLLFALQRFYPKMGRGRSDDRKVTYVFLQRPGFLF